MRRRPRAMRTAPRSAERISGRDGRVLRGRAVRAHLRGCEGCGDYLAAISQRRNDLRMLAPPLPALAATGLLAAIAGEGGKAGLATGLGSAGASAMTQGRRRDRSGRARHGRRRGNRRRSTCPSRARPIAGRLPQWRASRPQPRPPARGGTALRHRPRQAPAARAATPSGPPVPAKRMVARTGGRTAGTPVRRRARLGRARLRVDPTASQGRPSTPPAPGRPSRRSARARLIPLVRAPATPGAARPPHTSDHTSPQA